VLVCDLGMPGMDGYMLMKKIRGPPPPVTTTRVLRMELRLGDRLTDETGE
jgi:CheY-like chemotaxis protein